MLVRASGKREQGSRTVGLMGELIENKELGHKVAGEGFEGPALDTAAKGRNAE